MGHPGANMLDVGTASAISADPGFIMPQDEIGMIPPDTDADMKNCGACTMLNPNWATECEICQTKF